MFRTNIKKLTHYMYCLEIVELHQRQSETWTLLEPYHTDQNIRGAGEAAKKIKE
jgi:hypothetical protein